MKRLYILIVTFIFILLISCIEIYPKYSIKRIINKYPYIISITECWGFDGSGGDFNSPVALDIKMEDGKRLFISYIRSSFLKSPFILDLVEESTFNIKCGNSEKGFWGRSGIPIDFVSKNIKIKLNSVEDVIENYDLIYLFTNSLTKLTDINELLEIEDRYSINDNGIGHYGKSWTKHVKPIIDDEDNWYILNITKNEFSNTYDFIQIENKEKWEKRYIYYGKK